MVTERRLPRSKLVRAAPSFERWHITAFRPRASDLDKLKLEYRGVILSPQTVLYRASADGDRLGITSYLRATKRT